MAWGTQRIALRATEKARSVFGRRADCAVWGHAIRAVWDGCKFRCPEPTGIDSGNTISECARESGQFLSVRRGIDAGTARRERVSFSRAAGPAGLCGLPWLGDARAANASFAGEH